MSPIEIRTDVADAVAHGRPVVALESSVFAHGLPWPLSIEVARDVLSIIRGLGAVPAMTWVAQGEVHVGCDDEELMGLARNSGSVKLSRRDLAIAVAAGVDGATTVAATMACAAAAGIAVMATGGIGGVHLGGDESMDVSADLQELGRTAVAVVCSGAKSILDLPKTLEVLETLGVPVVGYRTDDFPAVFSRSSGLAAGWRADTPETAARMWLAHRALDLDGGMVIANPIPEKMAIDRAVIDEWVTCACVDAEDKGVEGKALMPFLLGRLADLSGGRTLEANVALLKSNANVAARLAVSLSAMA